MERERERNKEERERKKVRERKKERGRERDWGNNEGERFFDVIMCDGQSSSSSNRERKERMNVRECVWTKRERE